MERDTLEKIFAGLNDARVRYLVAGGLAVVAQLQRLAALSFSEKVEWLEMMQKRIAKFTNPARTPHSPAE